MAGKEKPSRFRRGLMLAALVGLLVVVGGGIACYAMRDRIVARVLDLASERLAEKGLYIERTSHTLTWNRGVVLHDLSLFADRARKTRVALFDNVGFRIPLYEIFRKDAKLILSSDAGDVRLDTPAGPLVLEKVDFSLLLGRESLEIRQLDSHLRNLRITASGTLRFGEGGGEEKEIKLPDLSPVVEAASWLDFPKGKPTLALRINSREGAAGGVDVAGDLSGSDFQWRNLSVDKARVGIALAEGAMEMPQLELACYGGKVSGALTIDYGKSQLRLVRLTSSADPLRLLAGMIGANPLSSFRVPGKAQLTGNDILFDLKDISRSRGTLQMNLPEGIGIPFGSSQIPLGKFAGELRFGDGSLVVDGREIAIYGGEGKATYKVWLSGDYHYELKLYLHGVSLAQAGRTFGLNNGLVGTLQATYDGGGATGLESSYGDGWVKVTNGQFYAIPFIGALRVFLAEKSPHFGTDEAKNLEASFSLRKGVLYSPDLRVESMTTQAAAKGQVNLTQKTLAVDVTANLKGLPGLATAMVSQIFEIHGEGPLDNVHWRMANVPPVLGGMEKVTGGGLKATGKGVKGVLKGVGGITGKVLRIPAREEPPPK